MRYFAFMGFIFAANASASPLEGNGSARAGLAISS